MAALLLGPVVQASSTPPRPGGDDAGIGLPPTTTASSATRGTRASASDHDVEEATRVARLPQRLEQHADDHGTDDDARLASAPPRITIV